MSWLVATPDVKRSVLDTLRQRICSSEQFGNDTISLSHTVNQSKDLDALLNGGITTGMVTELVGEAGVGKTQLCLQLLLNVQRSYEEGGLDSRALYFSTEGCAKPLIRRCQQMAELRGWDKSCMERILVKDDVCDGEDLLDALETAEHQILAVATEASDRIRLIVIDSVAHLFRITCDMPGARHYGLRSEMFQKVSNKLKQLAYAYQLAVVVTNQVTDYFADHRGTFNRKDTATGGAAMMTSGREVLPSLGLSWSNCINQRLLLSRCQAQSVGTNCPGVRSLRVAFSPHLPSCQQNFVVDQAGIRGVDSAKQHLVGFSTSLHSGDQGIRQPLDVPGATAAVSVVPEQAIASRPDMGTQDHEQRSFTPPPMDAQPHKISSGINTAAEIPAAATADDQRCELLLPGHNQQRQLNDCKQHVTIAATTQTRAEQAVWFDYSEEADTSMLATGVFAK